MRARLVHAALSLAVATMLAAAGAAAGAGDRPAPGRYRVTSTIPGETPRVREQCLAAEDIAEAFALPEAAGNCTDARTVAGGGRIDLARSCTDGRRATSGSLAGTYDASGYRLHLQSRAPELPRPLDVRLVAQRIGACTPD